MCPRSVVYGVGRWRVASQVSHRRFATRGGRDGGCDGPYQLENRTREGLALELDRMNPRIPGIGNGRSTRDIVATLIEHEDVLALAKSIVDFGGLYPNERLIAVDEDRERVVVEGNRRLAALKLLHSPGLHRRSTSNGFGT